MLNILHNIRILFYKMDKKVSEKPRKAKLINLRKKVLVRQSEMPDIEDAVTPMSLGKSPYFSPIQTRQQRKTAMNHLKEREVRGRKMKVETIKEKKTLHAVEVVESDGNNLISDITQPPVMKEEHQMNEPTKLDTSHDTKGDRWEPDNWQQVLENIRKMRLEWAAPVDSMGYHLCADNNADKKTQRFHNLVALMLSSQTKEETTFKAMQRLKLQTLTPLSILAMEETKLAEILRPVSFYRIKAKHLQQTSQILHETYDDDIPNTIEKMITLPGVGPKMAHLCMASAWNEVTGIGVDVHVHRIANRLRWVPLETKAPEKTRVALEKWLPRELWREVNNMLVGFGQTICAPLRPRCSECLNASICPSAVITQKKGSRNTLKKKVLI